MRLLRNLDNGAVVDWSEELAQRPNFVELDEQAIRDYFATPALVKANFGKPADYAADGVVFYSSATGIGDAISALYAAVGIARAGHKVTYHARHTNVFLPYLGEEPNLTVKPYGTDLGANCNAEYPMQMIAGRKEGVSRSQWYIRNLAKAYPIDPEIKPARPRLQSGSPVIAGRYVLLAPGTHHATRSWPVSHWVRLISLLRENQKVVLMGLKEDDLEDFRALNIESHFNRSQDWVAAAIEHASLLIGVDSGPAHLGGFFGTPTLALIAQTGQNFLYDTAPSVTALMPPESFSCAGCFWEKDGGYIGACKKACAAMSGISPFQVAESAMDALGKRKRKK